VEISLRRQTPIEYLVWDGRKNTFRTVQGQQKILMLSDTIVNPKTLDSIIAYIDFLLTRNQTSPGLSNLKLDMSFLSQGMEAFFSQGEEMPLNLRIRKEQANSFRFWSLVRQLKDKGGSSPPGSTCINKKGSAYACRHSCKNFKRSADVTKYDCFLP
jgi:hypothetical protein